MLTVEWKNLSHEHPKASASEDRSAAPEGDRE
jgi:hypothetical protein